MRRSVKLAPSRRSTVVLDTLEQRQLFSVVGVSSNMDWVSKIRQSHAGDTISFSPGTYVIHGNVDQPTQLPTDITYAGNGATIKGDGSSVVKFQNGKATDISGFTFDGAGLKLENTGGANVHDNTFKNKTGDVIFIGGNHDGHIDRNTFTNDNGYCVQGYPASNNTISYNRMDTIVEGVHLAGSVADNTQITGNVITNLSNHGIECQQGLTHLTISNNYIGGWQAGHSGFDISCSTGGNSSGVGAGEHIYITGNTLLGNSQGNGTAVEIMGDLDIHVDNNLMLGFTNGNWPAGGILNGTGGVKGEGLHTSGNTIQAVWTYSDGDSTPWRVPPRVSVNDKIFKPGQAGAPARPPVPTTAGARSVGTVAASVVTTSAVATTSTAAQTSGTLSIDAGGPAAGSYVADKGFSGGSTYTINSAIDTSKVTNAAPQSVYQSERWGNFTYTLANLTAGKKYVVRLDFAETNCTAANQRLFNVGINGSQVLSNFDIFAAAGGKNKAIAKTFTVAADSSGKIVIAFTTLKDNAKVSGISISPA